MHEIFITIIGVVHDFVGAFLFFGALCTITFGIWDFFSARRRWRIRQCYPNDYSGYIWPGESRFGRYSCFFRVNGYLILAFAVFTTTFMTAMIMAAMLALMLTGCNLLLCLVVSVLALTISGCAGCFGQCLLDEIENQMLECAELIATLRNLNRRTRRARRPALKRAQLTH